MKSIDRDSPDRTGRKAGTVLRAVRFLLLAIGLAVALGSLSPTGATAGITSPRVVLPGEAGPAAVRSTSGESVGWLVATDGNPAAAAIARGHGASPVPGTGGLFRLPAPQATALIRDLGQAGGLLYAEPDVETVEAGYPSDLLTKSQWWLPEVVDTEGVTPPRVKPSSPSLALIESSVDMDHPDLARSRLVDGISIPPAPEAEVAPDDHGTAVAGIAGSPVENKGIAGVWPGMNMRFFALGGTCSTATSAVYRAAKAGSAVINMSYGFPSDQCFSHYVATEYAVSRGSLPVASAGNTYDDIDSPNRSMRPASDPHVLSVSAIDRAGQVAQFATRNQAVDLTAPGVDVLAPRVRIEQGKVAYEHAGISGTSFSAPMVSAAATWLTQARDGLDSRQVMKLLTGSAVDLGSAGWDEESGAGRLDIGAALKQPTPPADPMEPNDDIGWVDGTLLKSGKTPLPAPFLWTPSSKPGPKVTATLTAQDDPTDVYRLKLKARTKTLIEVAQSQGDVSVRAFGPSADTVNGTEGLVVGSDRKAPFTEGIRIQNTLRRVQWAFLAISTSGLQKAGRTSRYKVTIKQG